MAWIQKREKKNGKTTYTALIRIKGYPPMSATFERLTDAKNWAAPIEADMKKGKHIKDVEARKHTLAELIDRYIEFELKHRKSDQEKFKTHLDWWKDKIGAYLLCEITPSLLSKQKDILSKEPSPKATKSLAPRSNATVNRYMASLSIVLSKAAKEWEWLEENPMLKVSKKKEPRGRTRFLSEDERKNLLEECKKIANELYLLVLISVTSGARFGEIVGLKWQHLDLKNKIYHFLNTKNGEDRGVPIASIALDEILKFSKVRNIKSDYVFIRPDGQRLIYFNAMFEKAVKNAGIEDFRFHDLRHTAASYLAMNGASLLEIAEILGHKTLAMVQRYSHLTKKHTAQVLENMASGMFEGARG